MHRQRVMSVPSTQRYSRVVTVALAASCAGFFALYIVLANHVSTRGYELARVQARVEAEQSTLETVQLEISAAKALNRIEAEAVSLSLAPVGAAEYGSAATAVATR